MLGLTNFCRRGVVHRWVQRRSPFDKTNFIENYVAPLHAKHERQAKWDDPTYNWPPRYEPPTRHSGRALITELEAEQ
jgi:hypothetical protein